MGTYNHLEYGTTSKGPADSVIILLHGMGSNADRTIAHAPGLAERLPNAYFYAPNASNRYVPALDPKTPDMDPEVTPGRFMWYSRYSEASRLEGLYETLALLDNYINECAAEHNLDRSRVVTVGLSQGAIVSNFCVPRLSEPIGATIAHSGYLFSPDSLARRRSQLPVFKDEAVNTITPNCLIHGLLDNVLPWQTGLEAATTMEENTIPVEFHLLSGLHHADFESRSREITVEFIKRHVYAT